MKTLSPFFHRVVALALAGSLLLSVSGCSKRENDQNSPNKNSKDDTIELTYYRLFDGEDIFEPLIKTYESEHPNIRISYKKFTDSEEYMDLIINELAEGEGPDMFSLQNTEFLAHQRKLTAAPTKLISPEAFEATFVPVASQNLLLKDESGETQVYGLPLYVDTLALYYNADHFKEAIPDREKPAETWSELQSDVAKLTVPDQSFERFKRAGIAMGRGDNLLRATDILYALFLQFGVKFYNTAFEEFTFAEGVNRPETILPAVEAFNLYLSFGLPDSPYFSWNSYLATSESTEKEAIAFTHGKVSMIFGYAYLYEQIQDAIKEEEAKGFEVMKEEAIQVAPLPTHEAQRSALASYFAETVSRTSQHPEEAWEFLNFLASQENLRYYHEKTHRPSSRRDLLDEQQSEPIYGIFAGQVDQAGTLPIPNSKKTDATLRTAIQDALTTKTPIQALQDAQTQLNEGN